MEAGRDGHPGLPLPVHDRCVVHAVKPRQCKTYPFWPEILESEQTWKAEGKECPGIGIGRHYGGEEIEELVAEKAFTAENSEDGSSPATTHHGE